MAERLPFGEIRPGARPIGAFVNPGSVQVAAAARPESMPVVSGFNAIQQGGQGNVQGYNQFAQIAEALAPFSKGLTQLVETGVTSYAKGKIEEGYYDELKNIQQRSILGLQMQQEQGAANAAGTITQLEKVDPPAAQLLRESNPWRLVGRRRALAQQAGSEVDNVLSMDLQLNQGVVSTLQPGSPELAQRKAALVQGVYSRYGLTGEEPEAAFYVTPKLNKAWDEYTDKQEKLFGEELRINTTAVTTASLGAGMVSSVKNGILITPQIVERWNALGLGAASPLTVGSVLTSGDPLFSQVLGSVLLTNEIDKVSTLFGGKDKAEMLKEVRTQLLGTYGGVPVLGDALGFVLGGSPADAVRPNWGASYGLDLLEVSNRGNGARQQQYEIGQKSIEQKLDELWMSEGGPGQMLRNDPNYGAALQTFRTGANALGYRDIDGYLDRKIKSQSSVSESLYPVDPIAAENFAQSIRDLPRSAFSTPEAVAALQQQAAQAARAEPTPELQRTRYREYMDEINKRKKDAAETTPGLQSAIDKALLQDLGLPQVKPLVDAAKGKSGGGGTSLLDLANANGAGMVAAVSGLGDAKVSAFTQRLNNLFLRNAEAKIDRWMAERPGVPLTSSARNVLISEAIAETRKSEEYKQAFRALTTSPSAPNGLNPGEVGTGPKLGEGPKNNGVPTRGYSRTEASTLPAPTVKGFAVRPVMDGNWLHSELQAVSQGKPVSRELYNMANTAGTTTNRYLLEQLRFYPQLDPNGEARKFLEGQIRSQRQGQTVSQANWQGVSRGTGMGMLPVGYNPLAPGSWLMNMMMPPAAAATLPPSFGGGYGGGGQWERGPAVAASHPDSGSGYTIPGMRDANGRPPIFSRGGANAFSAMVRDSNGQVKASDIASSQRSGSKNAAVGGANGSEHLKGNAMDIHGTSEAWIRKNGAKYGWYVHDYAGSHGGHFEFRGGGSPTPQVATRRGGGMTGLATYYNGSGGSDGVAGGPTANGERYNPNAMTAAVQWSLRGKYLNKWVTVEDMDSGKTVRVWVNDVGQMGGSERSVNASDPRVIDLSPAAFRKLFGSTQRGVGRIRILPG
jgi:hypothetical protein